MRAAVGNWPKPCNYLISLMFLNNVIATEKPLVAIPKQCHREHGQTTWRDVWLPQIVPNVTNPGRALCL